MRSRLVLLSREARFSPRGPIVLSTPTTGRSPVSAPTKFAANFRAFEARVTQNPATALEPDMLTASTTSFVTVSRSMND